MSLLSEGCYVVGLGALDNCSEKNVSGWSVGV